MDIPLVLDRIRPNAAWGWLGEDKGDYANLDWRDRIQSKPTLKEIEAAWPAVEAELAQEVEAAAKVEAARAKLASVDTSAGSVSLAADELAALVTLVRGY